MSITVTAAAKPAVTPAAGMAETWRPVELVGTATTTRREVLPESTDPGGSGVRVRPVVHRRRRHGAPRRCDTSAAPTLHGSRLTRRGRVLVAVAWLVLVALVVWPIVQGQESDLGSRTAPVRVQAGDTLWQLAQEIDPGGDARRIVDAIMELNGLHSGGDIRPGDTLRVPVVD